MHCSYLGLVPHQLGNPFYRHKYNGRMQGSEQVAVFLNSWSLRQL